MELIEIKQEYSVSGAITEEDMLRLKNEGVTTLICTRHDNEEEGQLTGLENESLAKKHGLVHYHIPVKSGEYSEQDVESFAKAYSAAEGKVHGYCRTGTRAAHLWALSQQDLTVALNCVEEKGINVSKLR